MKANWTTSAFTELTDLEFTSKTVNITGPLDMEIYQCLASNECGTAVQEFRVTVSCTYVRHTQLPSKTHFAEVLWIYFKNNTTMLMKYSMWITISLRVGKFGQCPVSRPVFGPSTQWMPFQCLALLRSCLTPCKASLRSCSPVHIHDIIGDLCG